MSDLFHAFLSEPCSDTYEPLRAAVRGASAYAPYSTDLAEAESALNDEDLDRAEQLLHDGMPNLLLNPNAHLMLSWIAQQRGDKEVARTEGYIASACVEGILGTGEGTEAKPYRVLRVDDEYDVLRYKKLRPKEQQLVRDDGRVLDAITCTDGTELWFDVTDPHSWLSRNLDA